MNALFQFKSSSPLGISQNIDFPHTSADCLSCIPLTTELTWSGFSCRDNNNNNIHPLHNARPTSGGSLTMSNTRHSHTPANHEGLYRGATNITSCSDDMLRKLPQLYILFPTKPPFLWFLGGYWICSFGILVRCRIANRVWSHAIQVQLNGTGMMVVGFPSFGSFEYNPLPHNSAIRTKSDRSYRWLVR